MHSTRVCLIRRLGAAAMAAALGASAAVWTLGCEEQGPAERAGEKLDDAARDTGRAVERAGEDLKDAARDAQR